MKTKWSCYYCQENLPTQKMLSDHRREKHLDPEGNFLCKFCEKKNPSYKFMGQHMRDKHPKQSFECVECDRTYPSLHQFKKHKGVKDLVFSPLVPSKREKNILVLLSLYIFLG